MPNVNAANPQDRSAGFQISFAIALVLVTIASCGLSLAQQMTVLHSFGGGMEGDG